MPKENEMNPISRYVEAFIRAKKAELAQDQELLSKAKSECIMYKGMVGEIEFARLKEIEESAVKSSCS